MAKQTEKKYRLPVKLDERVRQMAELLMIPKAAYIRQAVSQRLGRDERRVKRVKR